jgi:hypothetical protein
MNAGSTRTLLFAFLILFTSAAAFARVGVAITIGPPPLPVYEQPICPGDGYLWTPGYWGWGDDFNDYYWVPGTWVLAPEVGFLWTPPYWGWARDSYVFYDGYWGPQIGFYGGINYGFGYFGTGFVGGRWDNGHFFYNRSVSNINVTDIHNVYNTTVRDENRNRVSYNGGNGGIDARPTPQEEAAAHDRHIAPVAAQTQHMEEARSNLQQRASMNQGKPAVAATAKPGEFTGNGVVQAKEAGGPYTPRSNNRGENQAAQGVSAAPSGTAGHVRDLPPAEHLPPPNTGDPKLDKKYQKQQDKQYAAQQKQRQKLQKQQEREDAKLAKQKANDAQKQQVEQRHQQQTQQLQQQHQQQQQALRQRMQPPAVRAAGRPPR